MVRPAKSHIYTPADGTACKASQQSFVRFTCAVVPRRTSDCDSVMERLRTSCLGVRMRLIRGPIPHLNDLSRCATFYLKHGHIGHSLAHQKLGTYRLRPVIPQLRCAAHTLCPVLRLRIRLKGTAGVQSAAVLCQTGFARRSIISAHMAWILRFHR